MDEKREAGFLHCSHCPKARWSSSFIEADKLSYLIHQFPPLEHFYQSIHSWFFMKISSFSQSFMQYKPEIPQIVFVQQISFLVKVS